MSYVGLGDFGIAREHGYRGAILPRVPDYSTWEKKKAIQRLGVVTKESHSRRSVSAFAHKAFKAGKITETQARILGVSDALINKMRKARRQIPSRRAAALAYIK